MAIEKLDYGLSRFTVSRHTELKPFQDSPHILRWTLAMPWAGFPNLEKATDEAAGLVCTPLETKRLFDLGE